MVILVPKLISRFNNSAISDYLLFAALSIGLLLSEKVSKLKNHQWIYYVGFGFALVGVVIAYFYGILYGFIVFAILIIVLCLGKFFIAKTEEKTVTFRVKNGNDVEEFSIEVNLLPDNSVLKNIAEERRARWFGYASLEDFSYFNQIIAFLKTNDFEDIVDVNGKILNKYCFEIDVLYAISNQADRLKLKNLVDYCKTLINRLVSADTIFTFNVEDQTEMKIFQLPLEKLPANSVFHEYITKREINRDGSITVKGKFLYIHFIMKYLKYRCFVPLIKDGRIVTENGQVLENANLEERDLYFILYEAGMLKLEACRMHCIKLLNSLHMRNLQVITELPERNKIIAQKHPLVIATIGKKLEILTKQQHCIPYALAIQMYFRMKPIYPLFHYVLDLSNDGFKGCKFEYFLGGKEVGKPDIIVEDFDNEQSLRKWIESPNQVVDRLNELNSLIFKKVCGENYYVPPKNDDERIDQVPRQIIKLLQNPIHVQTNEGTLKVDGINMVTSSSTAYSPFKMVKNG
uniref:Uncharacterized protein n=1 Tax=Acrobeloides nanus TaxID=290746 RepID=A0A914ESJ2_9BILA